MGKIISMLVAESKARFLEYQGPSAKPQQEYFSPLDAIKSALASARPDDLSVLDDEIQAENPPYDDVHFAYQDAGAGEVLRSLRACVVLHRLLADSDVTQKTLEHYVATQNDPDE